MLVGRPPAAVAEELEPGAAVPALPADVVVERADSLVRRRPDVAAAERQAAAERAFVGAAKADYLPRITLSATAGYTADELGRIGDEGTSRYAVGPIVTWPFLNLGRVRARVDESRARGRGSRRAVYPDRAAGPPGSRDGTLAIPDVARAGRADPDAAAASARASDLARLRFEGGVADFLEVLDAERTQLDAEDQLAQAHTDAATSYAALYQALGGQVPASGGGSE